MLQLLAQVPNPPQSDLGGWLLALAIFLVIIDRGIAIFQAFFHKQEDFVPRHEFEEVKKELSSYVTRIELQRLEQWMTSLASDQKKLLEGHYSRTNEFNKQIADVNVTMERMNGSLREEIAKIGLLIVTKIEKAEKTAIEAHK